MKKALATLGIVGTLGLGGVDAFVLEETPIDRVEIIKGERVEAKQIGNVVETTLPWKGERGLKVKYDMGEPSIQEKLTDKRDKRVHFETNGNNVEYGLILEKRPKTNTFCYEVENAEQYDWFKQLPLTQEEIDEGDFRPDNIINSYAVYHKVLKNHELGKTNYETGKAFHRYRPQAIDANGNTSWGDSNFNGQICDTFDDTWLKNATYPVKI